MRAWHIALLVFGNWGQALATSRAVASAPASIQAYAAQICADPETQQKLDDGYYYEKYKNNGPKVRGTCLNRKPEGKWTYWNEKGIKLSEGNFQDGKGEGEFLYYAGKDPVTGQFKYLKGRYHAGEQEETTGPKAPQEGKDLQGRKHGFFVHTIDGEPRRKEQWQHGELVYRWLGGPKIFEEGKFAKGKKQGAWNEWHPNQRLKARGLYQKGAKEGVWHYYDSAGRLTEQVNYTAGMENGFVSYYSPNGDTLQGRFNKGIKEGRWVKRNRKNKVLEEIVYAKGKVQRAGSGRPQRGLAGKSEPKPRLKAKPSEKMIPIFPVTR